MSQGFTAPFPTVAKNGRSPSKWIILVRTVSPTASHLKFTPTLHIRFIPFIQISPQAIQVASNSPKWVTIADYASSLKVATNPPRLQVGQTNNGIWIFSKKTTYGSISTYLKYSIHSGKLTWNLKITYIIEQEYHPPSTSIFGFKMLMFRGVRLIETKGVPSLDAKLLVWLYTKCLGVFQFANLTPKMHHMHRRARWRGRTKKRGRQ